jgi:uncharacterized protein YggE
MSIRYGLWLFVSFVLCDAVVIDAQVGGRREERTISVQGIGRVLARPDQVQIQLGATTQAKTAKEAQAENADVMRRVIASLKGAGVPEDRIETAFFSINRIFEPTFEGRVAGDREGETAIFQASNFTKITLDAIDQVGRLIDTAIDAGANEVNFVTFTLKDDTLLRLQAMRMAIEDAKRKAGELSKAIGARLGTILSVHEVTLFRGGSFQGYPREVGSEVSGFIPGQNEVQVTVEVVFKVE